MRDVRDALLLVDDQVLDDVEVLGFRLCAQPRRVVAVGAAVVHVNVQVAAPPAACGKIHQALEAERARTPSRRRRPRRARATGAYSSPRVARTVYFPAGSVSVAEPLAWK